MYHSDGTRFVRLVLSALTALSLSGSCFMPVQAESSRLTTRQAAESKVSDTFTLPPAKKKLKKSPEEVVIYEFDESPLGDRSPLLMVHGLRGEFYTDFRWRNVVEHFQSDKTFNATYKVFLCRYPTLVRLEGTIPKFGKAIDKLYSACNDRQITIVALSMGGNLTYESMLDPDTDSKIKTVMALGSPFHGSPLFCEDWMQYSLYKRLSFPWTRVDHSLALRLYFNRNKNLLEDLAWDDADKAIPSPGKFKSRLLFGPKGSLTMASTVNSRLQKLNENTSEVKSKFITYGGYMHNPYLEPTAERYLESAAMYPITFFTIKFPAHLAREHPVLKMLNRDIACVDVSKDWKDSTKPAFLYALNDGITPLSSALFLPPSALKAVPLVSHDAVKKLRDKYDVRLARVFRDIDHLTYIDGDRPLGMSSKVQDELRPEAGEKDIFGWMLNDVLNNGGIEQKVADQSPTASPSGQEADGASQ